MATTWPTLEKDPDALRSASCGWGDFAVVTTRSPWAIAEPMLAVPPARTIFVPGLDRAQLDRCSTQAQGRDLIVGIGSGIAMETAKYVAKKLGARLSQVPSTASNNACFTRACWVFDAGGRTAERPMPIPDQIIANPDLVAAAPARLNRAGLAEILCSHTALFDWRLGYEAGRDVDWDEDLEILAREELSKLEGTAPAVGSDRVEAFLELLDSGARFAPGFTSHPKARFNSGSEHLFAWALEAHAGRRLIHGEAVSLGILLMAFVQGNCPNWAAEIIRAAGIRFMPEDLGVTWDEVAETFAELPQFARKLPWYTIIDELAGADDAVSLQRRFLQARDFVCSLTP